MEPYKTLRFDEGKIPEGLMREHSLKAGVRGELRVTRGDLTFVDESGKRTQLSRGQVMFVAPESPHHLEEAEGAAIEIDFFRVGG
ncbi:MAG: tellurite resistance-related uncharacterized protein [Polyangiales bacterium]|jgi:tellurite resistance-related uncharacterized protein